MINETLKFTNKIRAILKDAQTGETINIITIPNTVTNTGKDLILDALAGTANQYIKHCAVGHSGGTTSAGTILLVSELTRVEPVYSRLSEVGTFSAFFNVAQANSGFITEIGFFGGTSSFITTNTGKIFNRIVLTSGIAKTINHTLTIDLDVQF